jgi:flagella basal body P-ring formation protein FlgA
LIAALALFLLSIISAPTDVTIDAENVLLGDIVPFPALDSRASISLGYAPSPGVARRITKSEILSRVVSAGMAVDDLQLPDSILVHRRATEMDRDQVTRAVLDAFTKRFSDANIEITNVEIPAGQVGMGPLEVSASLPPRFDPAATVFVRVDVRGKSFAKTLYVQTTVHIETTQPVLKKRIAANAEIRQSDIEWKMAPLRTAGAPEQIDGMLAKRDLEPGQVLTSDLLYQPVYVRRGDSVTVRVTAGSVTIAATMRAKATGRLGETIAVEHLSGEGSTFARIVGPRTLEVNK